MLSGLFYPKSLDRSISNRRNVCLVLLLPCFIETPVLNANNVDPDQTPHSASSDLSLYCLPMSPLWDARLKWVKCNRKTFKGRTVLKGVLSKRKEFPVHGSKLLPFKKTPVVHRKANCKQ